MANIFKPKRSSTASSVPTTSDLADGEIAVNSSDKKIYLRDGQSVVEVANANIVDDTTPQLGGTLDTNGNLIQFGDSSSATDNRLQFGASQDLQIYHDASNSYIDETGTGSLILRASPSIELRKAGSTEKMLYAEPDAQVELYYNNSKKLETTSSGVDVSGYKLAVKDTQASGTGVQLHLWNNSVDNTSGNVWSGIRFTGSTSDYETAEIKGWRVHPGTGLNSLSINTGGVERMVLSSSGVGIGTDNPSDKLSIFADPNSSVIGAKDTTRGNYVFQLLADGVRGNGELHLYRHSASGTHEKTVEIRSSGNSYLKYGKFGIGTDNPEEILHVAAASETVNSRDGVLFQSTSALAADTGLPIVFTSNVGTDSNYGVASIAGRKENATSGEAGGYLQFSTGSSAGAITEKVRITSSGYVGIGTDNPDTTLHIEREVAQNDNVGILQVESINENTGSATNASIIVKNKYGYSQLMQWESNGLRLGVRSVANGGTGDLILTAGADGEKLRITSAGSLQVKGDTNPNAVFDRGSANTTNVNFNYNGTLTGQLGAANSEFQISASGSSTPLTFFTNGSERLRIGTSGQLGLGGANYGTSGQVLTSNGSSSAPTWQNAGAGTDAGTLDGLDSSQFLRSDAADTATGTITISGLGNSLIAQHDVTSGNWSGRIISKNATLDCAAFLASYNGFPGLYAHNNALNAWHDVFINSHGTGDGQASVYLGTSYINGNIAWHAGNDGSGSGLDADTLDGVQASSFLRSDASDSATGVIDFLGGVTSTPAVRIKSAGNSWSEGLAIHPSADNGYALTFYRTSATLTTNTNTWAIGNLGQNSTNNFGLLRNGLTGGSGIRADAIFDVTQAGVFRFGFNPTVGSNSIWHAGNDGSGSGLDADTLDGVQASSFLRSDATDNTDTNVKIRFGGASITQQSGSSAVVQINGFSRIGALAMHRSANPTSGNGAPDADHEWLTNIGGVLRWGSNANTGDGKVWHSGNDGSGSGLDADNLDGYSWNNNQVGFSAWRSNQPTYHTFRSGTQSGTWTAEIVGSGKARFDGGLSVGTTNQDKFIHIRQDSSTTKHQVLIQNRTNDVSTAGIAFIASGSDFSDGQYAAIECLSGGTGTTSQSLKFITSASGGTPATALTIGSDQVMTGGTFHLGGSQIMSSAASLQVNGFMRTGSVYLHQGGGTPNSSAVEFKNTSQQPYWDTNKIWHAGNDGSGSGLDADTLDGINSGSFLRSDTADTISTQYTFSSTSVAVKLDFSGHAGASNYNYFMRAQNDGGVKAVHFVNGSTRSSDGGANTYTIRNDGGNLRLGKSNYQTYVEGSSFTYGSNTIWHAGNDGSGSGLDADTLDGIQGSSFLRSDANDTYTGTLSISGSINNASTGGSSGAILGNLEVGYGAAYNSISARSNSTLHLNYNSSGNVVVGASNTVWHAGNDGSGSGLDADTVDGIQGANFLRSDTSDTMTGELNVTRNSGVTGSSAPSYSQANIEVQTSDNHVPAIGFHRGGYSATTLYEYDGQLYANAWTTRAQTGLLLSSGNIGSYAITRTFEDSSQNLIIKTGSTGAAAGIEFRKSDDGFLGQLYFNSTSSGFLNGSWASWDLEKIRDGNLKIRRGSASYVVPPINTATYGGTYNIPIITGDFLYPNTDSGSVTITGSTGQITTPNHGNSSQWNTAYGWGNHASAGYITNGTNYNVNDAWLRENGDNAHVKIYGNSRQMVFRTDGETEYSSGVGAYAFAWMYGGDAAGNRRMLLDDNGDLWTSNNGWLSSALAGKYGSGSSPSFVNVYASEWLRNSVSGKGLYNQANDAHFYSAGGSYWHMNGDSGNMTAGGLILYSQYNSSQGNATNRKGYLYWDSSGFGLLSNDGSWAYRHNNTNADIYGTIRQDGSNTVWHAGNDGSGSGLDADTLDGLQVHTGTNNEVNKVVRTNSSGYLMTGWINTISGSRPRTTAPSRIYASDDGYIRYYSLSDFKVALGLPNSTYNRSISYSTTTGYHTGVMGHSNNYNANTTLCHLGSGFIDFWNSTSNAPDTGHWVGMQSFHAVNWQGVADQNYGWQIVNKGGSSGNLKMQAHWANTNYGWQTIWNSANDGSGSGLDADTVDGLQASQFIRSDADDTITKGSTWVLNQNISDWAFRFNNGNGTNSNVYMCHGTHGMHVRNDSSTTSTYLFDVYASNGNRFRVRGADAYVTMNGNAAWHAGNDGSGSGLDADTVDGAQAANLLGTHQTNNLNIVNKGYYTTATSGQNQNSGTISYGWGYQINGGWSHPYPDIVFGYHTGMRFGGHTSYGGCRFYADHPSRTSTILFSVGNGNSNVSVTNSLTAGGNVTAYSSDRRLKENFKNIESPLEKLSKLNGCSFDWIENIEDLGFTPDFAKNDIGLIAQEVEAVCPQAVAPAPFDHECDINAEDPEDRVYKSKSGENYLTVKYEKLVPLLVEAIKEQQEMIDRQQDDINNLKQQIKDL